MGLSVPCAGSGRPAPTPGLPSGSGSGRLTRDSRNTDETGECVMRLKQMMLCVSAVMLISALYPAGDLTLPARPERRRFGDRLLQQGSGGRHCCGRPLGEARASRSSATASSPGDKASVTRPRPESGRLLQDPLSGHRQGGKVPGWGNFAGPRGTPTIDGDLLYVMGQYGELVCLRTADAPRSGALVQDFGGERPNGAMRIKRSTMTRYLHARRLQGRSSRRQRTGEFGRRRLHRPAHYSSLVPPRSPA